MQTTTVQDILQYDPELLFWDSYTVPGSNTSEDQTTLKAVKVDDELETFTVTGLLAQNPGFYALVRKASECKIWKTYEIISNQAKELKIKPENIAWDKVFGRGTRNYQDKAPKKWKLNREHQDLEIFLQDAVTVTCEETGISHKVYLPIPVDLHDKLNFPTVSPLAYFDNVKELLRYYSKSGINLETCLDSQVLTGILITILRNKNLLGFCKDIVKANMFLSQAPKETLGHSIRFFYHLHSVVGIAPLSLNLEDTITLNNGFRYTGMSDAKIAEIQADFLLRNYMKLASGEVETSERDKLNISVAHRIAGKLKIYTDRAENESKNAKWNAKAGLVLIERLASSYPGQHTLVLSQVRTNIKILDILSEKLRDSMANKILELFPQDKTAGELARLFSTTSTKTLENELFSFEQELKEELGEFKKDKIMKVDFLSKLTSKK